MPDWEHKSLMNDATVAIAADKAGFKYVWASEHHFLDEYSHLSANDVIARLPAHATDRIHLGSGIFNPLPQVNHPAKVAETVAMLDHLSGGRFEFGTGRGAGSHEILGFLPGHDGPHRHPRDLGRRDRRVPEDVAAGHLRGLRGQVLVVAAAQGPAQALREAAPGRCGTPPATPAATRWPPARASASSASRSDSIQDLEPVMKVYRKAIAEAEPIGAFVNDNIMVASGAFVRRTRSSHRRPPACRAPNYLVSNVFRYHDTFPHPTQIPMWPETSSPTTPDDAALRARVGRHRGRPRSRRRAVPERGRPPGVDQLVFGIGHIPIEDTPRDDPAHG